MAPFGLHPSPRKPKTGNKGHGSGLRTEHLSTTGGAKSEVGNTSGATVNKTSAPKYGVGGGSHENEEQSVNWHDLPAVQEFTPEEVRRFVGLYSSARVKKGVLF